MGVQTYINPIGVKPKPYRGQTYTFDYLAEMGENGG